MKLAAPLVLALSLASPALAAPKVNPRQPSAAARAATTRIAERKIPTLVEHAKPKPVDLAKILTTPAASNAKPTKPTTPDAPPDPPLTSEELAVDVVELTPGLLRTPQIAAWLNGTSLAFGRFVGIWLDPQRRDQIVFGVSAQWIGGHSLLVECAGISFEPYKVRLLRMIDESKSELIGSLTLDLGGDTLAFVVPATQLTGWKQLGVMIGDADDAGYSVKIDKCTFTRL